MLTPPVFTSVSQLVDYVMEQEEVERNDIRLFIVLTGTDDMDKTELLELLEEDWSDTPTLYLLCDMIRAWDDDKTIIRRANLARKRWQLEDFRMNYECN